MKKITLFAFAIAALSFASCKKARTCTCTNTVSKTTTYPNGTVDNDPSYSYSDAFVSTTKLSKKSAKGLCASGKLVETETDTTPAGTTTEVTTTDKSCTVK